MLLYSRCSVVPGFALLYLADRVSWLLKTFLLLLKNGLYGTDFPYCLSPVMNDQKVAGWWVLMQRWLGALSCSGQPNGPPLFRSHDSQGSCRLKEGGGSLFLCKDRTGHLRGDEGRNIVNMNLC